MQGLVVEASDDEDEDIVQDVPEAQIIYDDNDGITFAFNVLQEGIKAKCQAHSSGGAEGLKLAKIAFALRLKFSKQFNMLQDFVDNLPGIGSQSPGELAAAYSSDSQYRTLS